MITLGLVANVDTNGVYVSMPGSRGVLRGPYKTVDSVVVGQVALLSTTDDGEVVVSGVVGGGLGVSVRSFGAKGDGLADDTAAIQSALDAATGGVVYAPAGAYRVDGTIAVPSNTVFRFAGADIRPDDPEVTAITLAAGSTLEGGTITSAEFWDGYNSSWTYAVVRVEGDGVTVRNVTLTNVARVGIGIDEADNTIIDGCRINGGYTTTLWNDDTNASVHFGIAFDPASGDTRGNLLVTGCIIRECVQGIYLGNYGAGDYARGVTIVGNTFEGLHNHGVYGEYTWGASITGNTFNRCCGPIVAGLYSVVSGNAMTTRDSGEDKDQPQISIRNATGCVVANNVVMGEAPTGGVVIDLSPLHSDAERAVCSNNIVTGNVVDISSGTSRGIRVGSGVMSECDNNLIVGNVVKAPGSENVGVITVGDPYAAGFGNAVSGNTVVIRGVSNGIHAFSQVGLRCSDNEVRLEYDAGSAKTISMIALVDSSSSILSCNRLAVTADWGTNVTVQGVTESGTTSGSRISETVYTFDPTKLAASSGLNLLSGSGALINESGTGAPTVPALIGSIWRRTNGGAGTSLYVKESGTDGSGWVGK